MLLVALRHVGGQQRLVGCTRQFERVGGRTAAADHEDETAHPRFEVAQHALGGASRCGLIRPGEQHDHLGARVQIPV